MSDFNNPKRTVREAESRSIKQPMIRTLSGTIKPEVKQCNKCFEVKPLRGFYVKVTWVGGKPKVTHRNMCVDCWDKFNGRVNTPKSEETSNTILEFLT